MLTQQQDALFDLALSLLKLWCMWVCVYMATIACNPASNIVQLTFYYCPLLLHKWAVIPPLLNKMDVFCIYLALFRVETKVLNALFLTAKATVFRHNLRFS